MTIYNIMESEKFFERLNNCKGQVDLVADNGAVYSLQKNTDGKVGYPLAYCDGIIRKIELKFHKAEDADAMFHYLMAGPRPRRERSIA